MAPIERGSAEWLARRDVHMLEQATEIAVNGWTMVGVFPTEEDAKDRNFHFCYTIGRSLEGHAELIVTGMSHNAGPLLGFLIDTWGQVDEQTPGVPFEVRSGANDGWLVLAPVPDGWRDELMTMTRAQVGEGFTALQVLWTDDEERWPWEPGHARMQRMAVEGDTMPVLAGNDWRPEGKRVAW